MPFNTSFKRDKAQGSTRESTPRTGAVAKKDPRGVSGKRPCRGISRPGVPLHGGDRYRHKATRNTRRGRGPRMQAAAKARDPEEERIPMARSSRWPYIRKMAWDRDRKARAQCWICGQSIDYSVAPSSTDESWEPDHVIPVHQCPELELDLTNIKASHRTCNRARGDGTNGENTIGQQSRIW